MIEVYPNIFIGRTDEYPSLAKKDMGVVNLASNEHYKFLGWSRGVNHQDDPHYIRYEAPGLLSLNWIDGPAAFYDWQGKGVENFTYILDWIDREIKTHPVLIACNQALSRSPSVAMLYIYKRSDPTIKTPFAEAVKEFTENVCPNYAPGGIANFLNEHWEEIV